MNFRDLTKEEIKLLQEQGCGAEDWGAITVHSDFMVSYLRNVYFSGKIKLGVFEKDVVFPGGVKRHSGIYNSAIHNCEIGNNVFIDKIYNYIANYIIGDDVIIQDSKEIYMDGDSTFGNGQEVQVLNEPGGREVMINDKLSAHFAYIFACYRHRPELIRRMQEMVGSYAESQRSAYGKIGNNVTIMNAGLIRNVRIGDNCFIEGASRLENGSINSNVHDPVHVGYGVIADDFIFSSGSRVEDGTMLTRCFIGQACYLGHTYSARDSLFFSNCRGENGEACAIFAGPYTVTHHKSTLLISGMFSFMNAGSGSNQSNHMYKLGPIHQGVIERGSKTTSDSYILWPAKIGAFSLIMGRHYKNSDTSKMPFSYLIENDDESYLVPAINLKSVGTIRDSQKFPQRDERKDPEKLDHINFNLLSPYTIQKMLKGKKVLEELEHICGETSFSYTYQSCIIKASSLKQGIVLYDIAIRKFLGNSLISRIENRDIQSDEELRMYLKPTIEAGKGEWRDISGVFVPQTELDRLICDIESGKISQIEEINQFFATQHKCYYEMEWTWAWEEIKEYYGLELESITVADVLDIVNKWEDAVISLDKMIYEDAKKEFSLAARTGFGIDGNRKEQKIDFEQVRGVFEKNSFVETVVKHIETKSALGKKVRSMLMRANS